MTSSDEDVTILATCFCLIIFISSGSGYSGSYVHRDRSIDRSINLSVVIKAPYALTTKSDLGFFPVTSSDEDITIFRGYYCKYQLAERPLRQGIICETSGKRTSQTSKQKHNRAKHFGWHWRFKNRFSGVFSKFSQNCPSRPATRQFVKTLKIQVKIYP